MLKTMEPVAHLPRQGEKILIVINNTDTHGSMTHNGAPCAREGSLIPKKMG